ncbi:hypothetical protein RCL1_002584 [Eukaryota sp. TZLM3-RCL]
MKRSSDLSSWISKRPRSESDPLFSQPLPSTSPADLPTATSLPSLALRTSETLPENSSQPPLSPPVVEKYSFQRSEVHSFFSKEPENKRKCLLCKSPKATVYNNPSTTTMRDHLNKFHPTWREEVSKSQNYQRTIPGASFPSLECVQPTHQQNQQFLQLLMDLFINQHLPFRLNECPEFKAVIKYLNINMKLVCRKSFKLAIMKSFKKSKCTVKQYLNSIKGKFSITTDVWTSSANDPFLGMTLHFINEHFKISSIVIDVCPFPHPHDASHLADVLQSTLDEYCISERLYCVTTDNGANITNAISYLNDGITTWTDACISEHRRCMGHILNLALQKALKSFVLDELKLIRKFARKSKKSSKLRQTLEAIAIAGRSVQVRTDTPTRWNSTYTMLKDYLDNLQVIIQFFAQETNPQFLSLILKDDQLTKIRLLSEVLEPFDVLTQQVSGDTYPTVSVSLKAFAKLLSKLEVKKKSCGNAYLATLLYRHCVDEVK